MVLCNSLINTMEKTEIIELVRRSFLIAILVGSSSLMKADEPDAMSTYPRISWAVMPQFNLNMPGNWKTLKSTDVSMTYGGGVGVNCKIQLKSDWFINAGFSVCYDILHIIESYISLKPVNLERWSTPVSISLGHSFRLFEDMDIVPLAGAEAAYCFSNKIKFTDGMDDYKWNRFNISWGIGCGLEFCNKYEIDMMGYFGLSHLIRRTNFDLYDNKVRMSFKYFF